MVLGTLSEVAWIPVWNTSHAFYILTPPRVSTNYGLWLCILVMIRSQSTTSSGVYTSDSLLPSFSTLLDWDPAPSSYSLWIYSSVACLSVCLLGLFPPTQLASVPCHFSALYSTVSHLITAPKSPISRSSIQYYFGGIWPESKCNLGNHSLSKGLSITTDSCYPFVHPGSKAALNWLSTMIRAL